MNKKISLVLFFFFIALTLNYSKNLILLKNTKEKWNQSIICDTLFLKEKYKLELNRFNEQRDYEDQYNSVLTFLKRENGIYRKIYQDSLFIFTKDIYFEDYNNDGINDILIQNTSSARSNLTFHLYLVDTVNDLLHKIKGFEKIPNPSFNPQHNIITNYALSGKNWTSFYKIDNDSILNFGFVIYDNKKTGNKSYDKEYKKVIRKIKKNKSHSTIYHLE